MKPSKPELVTSARVAELTGYSVAWVTAQARAGDIPGAVRLTERADWRFDEAAVKRWIKRQEVQPGPVVTDRVRSGGQAWDPGPYRGDEGYLRMFGLRPPRRPTSKGKRRPRP